MKEKIFVVQQGTQAFVYVFCEGSSLQKHTVLYL